MGRSFRPKDAIIRYLINKEKTAWQHPSRCTSARPQIAAISTILTEVTEKAKFKKGHFLTICPMIGNAPFAAPEKECSGRSPGLGRLRNPNLLIIESKEVPTYGPEG